MRRAGSRMIFIKAPNKLVYLCQAKLRFAPAQPKT